MVANGNRGRYHQLDLTDPRELVSWVNKIHCYTEAPDNWDPHELASWVNKIASYRQWIGSRDY